MMAYVCFRREGLEPAPAYRALGVYGGDDGLTADAKPDALERTYRIFGQEMKAESIQRGQPGVTFLSRIYSPDVWTGAPHSVCDIRRQLAKIHVSSTRAHRGQSPESKLLQKCLGYLQTDAETPVIGVLARFVCSRFGDIKPTGERSWWSQWEGESVQFPNKFGSWMEDVLFEQMPTFDLKRFQDHLTSCSTDPARVLCFPICMERAPVPGGAMVVAGDYIGDTHPALVEGPVIVKRPTPAPTKKKSGPKSMIAKIGKPKGKPKSKPKGKLASKAKVHSSYGSKLDPVMTV